MGLHPIDRYFGTRVGTDIPGVSTPEVLLTRVTVAAADAPAVSAAGVLALTNLGATAQAAVTAGLANPAVPRGLSIVSNKSNAAGNVVITGTNYSNAAITETLALNGVTTRQGAKAFKTVTSVALPAQTNTPVAQVETATASGTATETATETVTVTSVLFEEAVAVEVEITGEDNAAAVAGKIRVALAADASVSAHFDVSGTSAAIILTAKVPAANDATLNVAIAGDVAGVDAAASSANTTAGVDYDKVSIGWNDKLGLPYQLSHNTVLAASLDNTRETTAPTVVFSATAIEGNTVDLDSALDGTQVDVYLMV